VGVNKMTASSHKNPIRILGAAGLLLALAIPLSGCGSSATQSLSYKDGVVFASGVNDPTQDGTQWAVNQASIGFDANTSCSILVELKAPGDNRSEWLQGCVYEFNHLIYLSEHPGAG